MNEREFYDMCYEEYKREMDQAEGLYQRAGVLLTALPVLGALVYALGRVDLLSRVFERVDIFLYYLAIACALFFLVVSVWFFVHTVFPRKYETLATMKDWQLWRDTCRKGLRDAGEEPISTEEGEEAEKDEEFVGKQTLRLMIGLLADAQAKNAAINEKRRQWFNRSIRAAAVVMVAVAVESVFCLILHLEKL